MDKSIVFSLENLQNDFISLCHNAGVIVYKGGKLWITLDKLWYEVEGYKQYTQITLDFLKFLLEYKLPVGYSSNNTIIITPDTLSSSYGSAPAVFMAASQLGLPVAVWQEQYGPMPGKSIMIGTNRKDLQCIVIQDVIKHGTTILRMLDNIESQHWRLVTYACFVLNCWDETYLETTKNEYQRQTKTKLDIQYLVKADWIIQNKVG